VINAVGTAP